MGWREFFSQFGETLGISATFAFAGSALLLWIDGNRKPATQATMGQAMAVIVAGLLVASCATSFVHGYLMWNIFVAPLVGFVCGLVAMPIVRAVVKGGRRVEARADDITDAGIEKLGGKKDMT